MTGAGIRAGDVDGDGVLDILIGAPGVDGPSNDRADAGATYVLWGGASLTSRTLSQADVTIYGAGAGDRSGASVASGDVNRDTTDDVVMAGGMRLPR